MMIRTNAVASVAALTVAGGLALAVPAHAQVRPLVHTVRITGNYDSGTHGVWASLAYGRTVRISHLQGQQWAVTLTDKGTFKTIKGAKSPEAGLTIANAVKGTFKGTYRFTVTSAHQPSARDVNRRYNYRCDLHGAGNRDTDCPGMPASTSAWPTLYFGRDAQVKTGNWVWDYRTRCERWINSSSGDSGDITGDSCRGGSQGHGGDTGHGQDGSQSHGTRTVTPGRPVARSASCETGKGQIITPYTRGVAYSLWDHGTQVDPTYYKGGYPAVPGVYTVVASARSGYRLKPRTQHVWQVTVTAPRWCPRPSATPTGR